MPPVLESGGEGGGGSGAGFRVRSDAGSLPFEGGEMRNKKAAQKGGDISVEN